MVETRSTNFSYRWKLWLISTGNVADQRIPPPNGLLIGSTIVSRVRAGDDQTAPTTFRSFWQTGHIRGWRGGSSAFVVLERLNFVAA